MSSLQPALVSDLRGKLWQRAGSSQRVYHGIQARHRLGRQTRWQEEAQEWTCGWRGAHNSGDPCTQPLACAIGHPSKGGDVTGTSVSTRRQRTHPRSWATCTSTERIPPSFTSMLVTHTELEKIKKKRSPKHCYFGFMKNRLFTR